MNFEQYERDGQALYNRFSQIVSEILYSAIKVESGFRLQLIKSRAKEATSLYKKLEDKNLVATNDLENEIKDLAGCRIIFYTNTDVSRFINSGLISQNFEISDTKIHHPARDNDNSTELYISNHYVVLLKDDRTALPEYAPFKNMRCEIQIQTILNHAWAEMAHNTIYKMPKLEKFGVKELEGIKNRLGQVSKKYLVPAGYEFQKIAIDFQRLIDGKKLFDNDALAAIIISKDNNSLAEDLDTFSEYVLPYYDDIETLYPEIVSRLLIAGNKARETQAVVIETPFGNIPGKTYKDILKIITGILTRYRYCDVDLTFSALCSLFKIAQNESELDLILESCTTLAANNLNVWKKHGPAVQRTLINHIESFSDDKRIEVMIPVLAVLGEILNTEISGTSSDSSTVTFHRAAVSPSLTLKKMRTQTIFLLKKLYDSANSDDHHKAIINALRTATTTPYSGYSNELLQLVLESTLEVLDFYVEIAPTISYETLQSLESDVHHLYRRYRNLPDSMRNEPDLVTAAEAACAAAIRFRDIANVDEDFLIYKALVGFNSIYPPAWESDHFQNTESETYRRAQVRKFLNSITNDNSGEWLLKIKRCAYTESNDMMTFPVFISFLEQLATEKPEIAFNYIETIDEPLTNFLPTLLNGLMHSAENARARTIQSTWIARGEKLDHISWYLRYTDVFDEALLDEILQSAIRGNNKLAICNTITAAGLQFKNTPGTLIKNIFLPAIRAASERNLFNWLEHSRISWLANPLIKALDDLQSAELLDVIVVYPKLEYNAEYIATNVAEKFPLRVLEFISKRIEFGHLKDGGSSYEALPFQIHQLNAPLSKIPSEMIAASKTWFELNPSHFQFEGAKLIASIFPELSNEVDKFLEAKIKEDSENFRFVLNVLSAYEGAECVYPLVHSIVCALGAESDLLKLANSVLNQTGVIEGEFGIVEIFEERKKWISEWLPSTNPVIISFVNNRVAELNYNIALETRSAEAGVALRKLQYGEEIV